MKNGNVFISGASKGIGKIIAYYFAKNKKLSIYRIPVLFSSRLHGVSHWNFSLMSKFKFIKRTVLYSIKLKKKLNSL